MNYKVKSFYHEYTNTWTHLVVCHNTKKGVLVDPVLDYNPNNANTSTIFIDGILDYIEEKYIKLLYVVETHAHADHLTSAAYINGKTGAKIAIGENILSIQTTFKAVFNFGCEFKTDGSQFDRLLKHNDVLSFGECKMSVIYTPGHTDDSVSYCIGDSVFIGDTLFSPEYGSARCDFPGGDAGKLYDSVHEIYQLGEHKKLYLCHDYPPKHRKPRAWFSSLEQQQENIHLNLNMTKGEFIKLRNQRDAGLNQPRLIIPSIQINISAGYLPAQESNGSVYLLKFPDNYQLPLSCHHLQ